MKQYNIDRVTKERVWISQIAGKFFGNQEQSEKTLSADSIPNNSHVNKAFTRRLGWFAQLFHHIINNNQVGLTYIISSFKPKFWLFIYSSILGSHLPWIIQKKKAKCCVQQEKSLVCRTRQKGHNIIVIIR